MSELIEALRGDIINHSKEDAYVVPKEAAVRERLEWFRDQKLALMVHLSLIHISEPTRH